MLSALTSNCMFGHFVAAAIILAGACLRCFIYQVCGFDAGNWSQKALLLMSH